MRLRAGARSLDETEKSRRNLAHKKNVESDSPILSKLGGFIGLDMPQL